MSAVFFVLAGFLGVWSAIRYQIVYRSVVETLPPQFQDDLSSRYAFPVYALSHSTPLPLQMEYMKSQGCGCAFLLSISLGFFSYNNIPFGCFFLLGFFWSAFSTMKSWRTYKENCGRAENQQAKE